MELEKKFSEGDHPIDENKEGDHPIEDNKEGNHPIEENKEGLPISFADLD